MKKQTKIETENTRHLLPEITPPEPPELPEFNFDFSGQVMGVVLNTPIRDMEGKLFSKLSGIFASQDNLFLTLKLLNPEGTLCKIPLANVEIMFIEPLKIQKNTHPPNYIN